MNSRQAQQQQQQNYGNRFKVVAGYTLQQRLGSGSFATVYKGVRLPPSESSATGTNDSQETSSSEAQTVAIKAITRTSEKLTSKVLQNLELEIQILRTYRHPNIVCMHNAQKTERHFYLILEYCGGGDVQRLIRTRKAGRLTERLTRRLMRDLGAGLKFLWAQELIHRDIKPQNLLLTGALPLDELEDPEATPEAEAKRREINFPSSQFQLKIADFGFARHLQTQSLAETLCGSPLYMAPEILQHHRYDAKADLWSVGTVLFEMISGRPPFNGENHIDLLRNIQRKAVRLPPDVRVSKACVNLLRMLLNRNPLSRAGFQEFFEACDAFVALGCEGAATVDSGTKIPNKDLGTIQENEGSGSSDESSSSDSLMTAGTAAPPPFQQTPQHQPQQGNPDTVPAAPLMSPPFNHHATPTSLVPTQAPQSMVVNDRTTRQYTTRLAPLQPSPPGAHPVPQMGTRVPNMPSLTLPGKQPWPQPQTQLTYKAEISQPSRGADLTRSGASTDDSGFVMVENNDLYPPSGAMGGNPYGLTQSPSPSPRYFLNQNVPRVEYGGTAAMATASPNQKGMLGTSPGTGGLLMGLVNRARLGSDPRTAPSDSPDNRIEVHIANASKMIATAEDVGRRAISVAHLGDTRAYVAMRLVFRAEEGSSVLSSNRMEDVVEDPREEDDSSSTRIRGAMRRHSSMSSDKIMADTKDDDEETEEMPFAISPDAAPVTMPTRGGSLSIYNKSTSASASKRASTKPDPRSIRSHFGEALTCYLKALKMLKGAVGAAQRVSKDIEQLSPHAVNSANESEVLRLKSRCEVTSNWLGAQFRGVLERADAANVEISKLPSVDTSSSEQAPKVRSVEELIYSHSLASGRDGAVKQLLGQLDAARSCYRSAGLLAETLLMESIVAGNDRKTLENYVDEFAARINELDNLMLQQSRMSTSAATNSSRRGSGVVGLIGPPPSVPTTLTGNI